MTLTKQQINMVKEKMHSQGGMDFPATLVDQIIILDFAK